MHKEVKHLDQRIKDISDAATTLFIKQGYTKTQINHIAKAVGVSVGTIYLNFAGKKEIMQFILKCTIEPDFINNSFSKPITDDLFVGLENQIIDIFKKSGDTFASHLKNNLIGYSFEEFISDSFDILSQYAVGCLFIEKNQFDFKRLSEYYITYRKQFLDTMTHYMTEFITRGTVRQLEHIELSTTLIIEILSWWAMDIHYTSFQTQDISSDLAKQICMDNIITAYKK
ncbi:TetR/AcrR family transcriptional regulator [Clostridioides difficile]|nr:TetR/AcrR family transcriptional regulator [Clostridioides difficile]